MGYELPTLAAAVVGVVAVAGVLAGVVLAGVTATGALARARWPEVGVGAAALVSAAFAGLVAGERDSYFDDGTTRWQFAGPGGQAVVVASALIAVVALALLVLARPDSPRRPLRVPGLALAAVACAVAIVAVVSVSSGR